MKMKLTCDEFWQMPLIDLMDQIVIWTGISVGDVSGSESSAAESAERRLRSQLEIRQRIMKSIADGFTEIARAELITWLQQEGYVEDETDDWLCCECDRELDDDAMCQNPRCCEGPMARGETR